MLPLISGYGSSYGTYGGSRLLDFSSIGDIDSSKLNKNLEVDGVQFNLFERSISDYVMAQLGYPVIAVELTPFQIKTCIDEALSKLDYHAPQWMTQFAVFDAVAGQNVYELPQFMINNLVFVGYKRDVFGLNYTPNSFSNDIALAFFNSNKFFQGGDLGDFYLTQQYMKIMRRVLGNEGSWSVINNREIQLYPSPRETPSPVIVEYRAIDSNTIHHAYRNWVQRFTLAVAKGILGRIRGKYRVLPGPGGGAQLDGGTLVQESNDEKQNLMEELRSDISEGPLFIIG
jgi:hypothetical protein